MSPGNPFILESKFNVTSHKNSAGVGLCTLVSVRWLLLVIILHILETRHIHRCGSVIGFVAQR